MSEMANFTYEGNAKLSLKSPTPQEIKVLQIQHMIPINVSCQIDGVDSVVTAFIDYGTHQLVVSAEGNPPSLDVEAFRDSLFAFLGSNEEQMKEEFDIESPEPTKPDVDQPLIPPTIPEEE